MAIDLTQATAPQLVALGTRVRRVSEAAQLTMDEISARIVDLIFSEVSSTSVLVRAYRTRPLHSLTPELIAKARASAADLVDETRCLVLTASRGYEPAWNDVNRSVGHRVIPLRDEAAIRALPMVSALFAQLGSNARSDARADVFFVPDAVGSPLVPAQHEFVLRYNVRSVVGCGGVMPDGETFALMIFATVMIPAQTVRELDGIGQQARIALLNASDFQAPAERIAVARASALDDLLRLSEYRYQSLSRDRDAVSMELGRARADASTQESISTQRARRSQQAMINVIDDLREARNALEVRVAERTAQLEARNRELEQFAYIASHDLQEPLRTVAGYLQLIEVRYAVHLDQDAHEFIRFAVEGAQRMQQLIEALLSYSRITSKELTTEWVDLNSVVDEVLRALDRSVRESDATIDRAPLPAVRGDRIQLGQVFQNLIGNALKFRGNAPARIAVSARRDNDHHVIAVRDEGIGFHMKHADRVFAVFRRLQRTHTGTGIGLAICKKIVERHGGTIRVAATAPGEGATFEVRLPSS
ncbi:MAG: ATP-binding protein [Kofleriaceae bacterium]